MPEILTINDTIMCPHGGMVQLASAQAKASAGQGFMLRASDTFIVSACAFSTPGGPHPCLTVSWSNPAQKCTAGGEAVLTTASVGQCKAGDQAVQGTAMIQKTQKKASAL